MMEPCAIPLHTIRFFPDNQIFCPLLSSSYRSPYLYISFSFDHVPTYLHVHVLEPHCTDTLEGASQKVRLLEENKTAHIRFGTVTDNFVKGSGANLTSMSVPQHIPFLRECYTKAILYSAGVNVKPSLDCILVVHTFR